MCLSNWKRPGLIIGMDELMDNTGGRDVTCMIIYCI